MDKPLKKLTFEAPVASDSDVALVIDFLKFSALDLPSGPALQDRILSSLALALNRKTAAH